jgi:hippurate hydrolase
MKLSSIAVAAACLSCSADHALARPPAGPASSRDEAEAVLAGAQALYTDLHQHPELSWHEEQTAARLAQALRALGFEVTEHVGGTGVVALMKNGAGPTLMLRTELDALPVEEETGLPYASRVRAKDDAGRDVGVMHACGHDLHMAALVGTATVLARSRGTWHGTLMLLGQPAEETISGAPRMIKEGLLTRFPRPDVAVALHVSNYEPAGKIALRSGTQYANADSIRVTLYGKGGHGSQPHTTVDPIVLASRTVLALQTIASREVKPGEVAIVTVGYIRAGTKNNIISDRAELGLTVRTYRPEIRRQVLAAIARIVKAEAAAAGSPREPLVETYETTDAVINDPGLTERLRAALAAKLGKSNVGVGEPITGSEDFSYFLKEGIPGVYFGLGGADPKKWAEAKAAGTELVSNHSPSFAPDVRPALATGIAAEVEALRYFFGMKPEEIRRASEQGDAKR